MSDAPDIDLVFEDEIAPAFSKLVEDCQELVASTVGHLEEKHPAVVL